VVFAARCARVTSYGSFRVEASAPGFLTVEERHDHLPEGNAVRLKLVPGPSPLPVGNLMPPQPPPDLPQ
jgi:hypothetical protein